MSDDVKKRDQDHNHDCKAHGCIAVEFNPPIALDMFTDFVDAIFHPSAFAARRSVEIGKAMQATQPCVCGHGEPFHRVARRTFQLDVPDGQCTMPNCDCKNYQLAPKRVTRVRVCS